MSRGRVCLLAVLPVLIAMLVAGGAVLPASASLLGDQVTIDTGAVRGTVTLDHRAFLGIPFAASTAGQGRFRPPQPVPPWTGTRDATASGPGCAQTPLPSSEDCLTIDVYTPPAWSGGNLPVMFWIYGGGYAFGSSGGYDPAPLLKQNVIVAIANYRVGPFGFLSLPGLDAESATGTSGNYGLMDQQAGLRWVQRNIGAFGGNPHDVTIFGESAGGNSVCQQVASPQSAGLFQRAIVQSGSCAGKNGLSTVPKAEMQQRSRALAQELGCTDPATEVACLRALPQDRLLSSKTLQFNLNLTWAPSVDGVIEPRALDQAWRAGAYQKVPLMIGGTHDEGRTFVALLDHALKLAPVGAAGYQSWVRTTFGANADAVLAKYPLSVFASPDLAKATVLTDSNFSCPLQLSLNEATASGATVYTFELADADPPLAGADPLMPLGNFHGSDVLYLFNSLQGIPSVRDTAQQSLSNQMVLAWTTFARTGQPGAIGALDWPVWTPADPRTVELDSAGNRLANDVAAAHSCAFWAPIIG
ncbi:MAG TPA: carboxylesterase family protein [Rugosimonospora sp.]|nr:carboxylesterase family protein [Rugosimonospora sp.]